MAQALLHDLLAAQLPLLVLPGGKIDERPDILPGLKAEGSYA